MALNLTFAAVQWIRKIGQSDPGDRVLYEFGECSQAARYDCTARRKSDH